MLVLARAYGSEPLVRRVVGGERSLVYLVDPSAVVATGQASSSGVGFPVVDVFECDDALGSALRAAYDSGRSDDLMTEWARARPVTLPATA